MSHDTHQHITENKPRTGLTASFWFVIILVGLFIAAVNFVSVMSQSEEGEGAKKEATHEGAAKAEGEKATEKPAAEAHTATADTTHAAH
jgi:hypothetical protein